MSTLLCARGPQKPRARGTTALVIARGVPGCHCRAVSGHPELQLQVVVDSFVVIWGLQDTRTAFGLFRHLKAYLAGS